MHNCSGGHLVYDGGDGALGDVNRFVHKTADGAGQLVQYGVVKPLTNLVDRITKKLPGLKNVANPITNDVNGVTNKLLHVGLGTGQNVVLAATRLLNNLLGNKHQADYYYE